MRISSAPEPRQMAPANDTDTLDALRAALEVEQAAVATGTNKDPRRR
jgi:hypothetical protein